MSPATILNVDDNDAGRYLISSTLRRAGFEVVEAATGEKALQLAEEKPDLILLDVNLPDVDGFEICRRLKNNPDTSSIPILHISATHRDSNAAVTGMEVGADGYLTQPVDPAVLVATVRTHLRARKAEAELAIINRQWYATFEAIQDGICLTDSTGKILRNNHAFLCFVNADTPDVRNQFIHDVLAFDVTTEEAHEGERLVGGRWYRLRIYPIAAPAGSDSGKVYVLTDITQSKKATQDIQNLHKRLQTIVDNTTAVIYIVDQDNRLRLVNQRFAKNVGRPSEELEGRNLFDLFPAEFAQTFADNNREVIRIGGPVEFEETVPEQDGIHTYISIKVPLPDENGNAVVCGISTDITDRKQAEEELKKTIRLRETLLREIHHRVKNNLQVVSSLLGLQGQKVQHPEIQEVLSESRARIRSMALIHETLHEGCFTESIDLSAYLNTLTVELIRSYGVDQKIDLVYEAQSVTGDFPIAMPLGLILNELVSNSLKYAFPPGSDGKLVIRLWEKDGSIHLEVIDNGPGLPAALNPANASTLGLRLVDLLVSQLRGKIEMNPSSVPGAHFHLSFPVNRV